MAQRCHIPKVPYTNQSCLLFICHLWRYLCQTVADLAKTAIDYPPMQAPATFNLDAVKKEIEEKIKQHEGE